MTAQRFNGQPVFEKAGFWDFKLKKRTKLQKELHVHQETLTSLEKAYSSDASVIHRIASLKAEVAKLKIDIEETF